MPSGTFKVEIGYFDANNLAVRVDGFQGITRSEAAAIARKEMGRNSNYERARIVDNVPGSLETMIVKHGYC